MRKTLLDSERVQLKSYDDISRIAEAGYILRKIFDGLTKQSLVSHSTLEIDSWISHTIYSCKARPAFETVEGFSHAACISINDEVVHGIPSKKRIIHKGDIVKIDIGVVKGGYFADACRTINTNPDDFPNARLVNVSRTIQQTVCQSLAEGMNINSIGDDIEKMCDEFGYSVLRQFTGHGVGFALHEPPVILHYKNDINTQRLKEGFVIAVEPVIAEHKTEVYIEDDDWTVKTVDGTLSAQFEDTIAITKNGPRILT
jgi:methionyl aminopeptidase